MRFVLATARKDLFRLARDWPALLLWLGIPLAVGALMVLMFGSGGAGPTAKLLVVDQDGSIGARLLMGAFGQGQLGELVEVETVGFEEGNRRIEKGDASGLLVVPEGFGSAVLNGRPVTLELVTNPSETILPGILEGTLDTMLEAAEVLRRLFDEPLDRVAATAALDASPADSTVASISTAFNQAGGGARSWLLPPAIQLETVALDEDEEPFDFGRAFFPGMLILAVLFMAGGLSSDVWAERRQGTLKRAVMAPTGSFAIVAGKWIAGGTALGAVAAIGLGVGAGVFGIEAQSPLVAFAWIAVAGTLFLALFTTIQLLAPSETAGNVIQNAITLPMAMLGGSFFPFETMPSWMAAAGMRTPNGWALVRLREIMEGAYEPGLVLASAAVALALVLLLAWLAARRLRGFAT